MEAKITAVKAARSAQKENPDRISCAIRGALWRDF